MKYDKLKYNKGISRISVVLLIIVILCVLIGIYINLINKKQNDIIENNNLDEGNLNVENNNSTIDFKYLENAKVENGVKKNISEKLSKDKEFDGLKVSNIVLESKSDGSCISAKVTNNTGKKYEEKIVVLKFLDKNNNEFANLEVIIHTFENGEEQIINGLTTADLINAYDFVIENTN